VTSHETERDCGAITLLFSIAPLSNVQLENPVWTHCSSQIHALPATLGWVLDLSFPIDMCRAVVSRNAWYL
jgi:hypothetical protein